MRSAKYRTPLTNLLGLTRENSGGSVGVQALYFQQNGATVGSGAGGSWEHHPCQWICSDNSAVLGIVKQNPNTEKASEAQLWQRVGKSRRAGRSVGSRPRGTQLQCGAHNGVPVAAATREGIVCGPQCAWAPRAEPLAATLMSSKFTVEAGDKK